MRDVLPVEKARRERLLAVIRRSFRAHGFDEIETPVMEDSDRLHAGLGGDNEKLAFGVLRRGLTHDDLQAAAEPLDLVDLGLRFDLTVPLARFYATHRAELPTVFRAIQMAPVWRAERPQKGRYRQFVQCDIDIIGEPGIQAEAELLVATLATVDALGLRDSVIRINDRRLLNGMLDTLGFAADERDAVLITIDKLDKVGQDGVIAELRDRAVTPAAVDALDTFFRRPMTMEYLPFGDRAIRRALPAAADEAVIAELVALGEAVHAARRAPGSGAEQLAMQPAVLEFDPFLVRGMGYYTGPIFELAHPSVPYSLGGGGRYDGMIGRFLGSNVPATGFSLGFERLVDLLEMEPEDAAPATALLYDEDVPLATLLALKTELLGGGGRVRLVARPKNTKSLLESLEAEGFTRFAFVDARVDNVAELELRHLGA
ncbi:MAG TPA: ATP phosphoribosyltransferase regulatory subunit [Pseudolysinimonas sp.]|nr:ATP phosphoribosyltransferase regulatory subunit [Pseudolysinimonas sp.]